MVARGLGALPCFQCKVLIMQNEWVLEHICSTTLCLYLAIPYCTIKNFVKKVDLTLSFLTIIKKINLISKKKKSEVAKHRRSREVGKEKEGKCKKWEVRGTWVAQVVKPLTPGFSSGDDLMILWVRAASYGAPHWWCRVWVGFSLPLSLSLPLSVSTSLSLSK